MRAKVYAPDAWSCRSRRTRAAGWADTRDPASRMATAGIDEVIAHMAARSAVELAAACLAGALDGLQRHAPLPFAGRGGQRFHRLPLLVPAQEVHPVVCTRRIAPQHVLDRLTVSTYSGQSSVAHSRRLVTALATETCATASRWCSPRMVSSAVVWQAARSSSTAAPHRRNAEGRTHGSGATAAR